MNIQQQPDALSLSGNMKEIILSGVADSEVVFRLFTPASETPILERKYAPDSAGVINIDIRRFIDDRQSFLMSSSTSPWQQPNLACTYYFTAGDQTSDNFTVVRGGVAQLADTAANWLAQNFLTWQPTTKKVTYATPELLTYYAQQACNVIVKVYYPDGTSEVLTGISLTAGAWTIPVSFATVAARVVNLPGAYDVWIEDGQGNRLTYVQRYIADSMREDEQWILFENSLGGVDVFRAYGKGTMEASHEHQIAESDDNLDEYRVDLKRQYRRSTGWMDKNQRRWMLDFFPARRRWILQDGAMLPIVLTEDTASYTMDNMPAEFEFTFRYASAKPYLNIPRVEVPAAVMDITAPDMQSFTIPPRLVEFPRISPSEGGLIPIQHPYSEKWSTLALEELLSIIAGAIEEATEDLDGRFAVDSQYYLWVRQVIGGVPTLHKIKAESADMWDGHQFGNYLDQPVRKEDDVEFKSVKSKRLEIGRFTSGLLGSGALLDENGNLVVESIFSRSFISSPEFRFNRVNVTEGENWCTNGFGVIEKVDIIDATSGYITLKLEENDYASVEVGDICRGIYNDITGRYQTADLDDDSELYGSAGESGDFGFPSKSGYFNSYFFVMDMEGTGCYNNRGACRFKYGLRNASTPHPCAFMKFAQYGNFDINSGRCSSSYESSMGKHYKMSLHGVTTWKISSANITTREDWLGDLYVTLNDGRQVQLQGYGLYVQDNVYFGNAVVQLDPYTLAQLQEELANYQVDFSDYVDVITVDDVGNVIGGLYTQEGQVRNYRIHSAITVKRGSDVLLLANDEDDAGPGTYKISVLPHGCSCIVQNSTLYITGIANVCDGVSSTPNDFDYDAMRAVESCSVDVTIDCEGKGSVVRKFPITIRHDSQPFVGADIDNEFSAVSWNTKTQAYVGLPIVLNMKMWHNNEQLDIASANDVSVSPAVTGMTVSKEIITVSGQKHARVTISALPASLSNVTKLNITAVATYAGVRYERTLTHTINKGTDVNVYSLKPSLDEIILNKNTGALSSSSLTCKVMCDSSDDKHYEVTLADLATHKLKLCYQIHYNDGTATTAETDYTAAGVTGLTNAVDKVVFKLYNQDKSIQYDEEGIPVIASGQDGKGVEYVYVRTETNTAPTISNNDDWTETIDGQEVTHHVTDDDFRPLTSAGRATDNPTGTTSQYKFEWIAKRVKRVIDGVLKWEGYSGAMSLWANWSKDGDSVIAQFAPNNNPSSTQIHDSFQTGDEWMRTKKTSDTNWGAWMRIVGEGGDPGPGTDYKVFDFGWSTAVSTSSSTTAPTLKSGTTWADAPSADPSAAGTIYYLWMRITPKIWQNNTRTWTDGTVTYQRIKGNTGEDAHEIGINILQRTNFDRGMDAIKEKWNSVLGGGNYWSHISLNTADKVDGRSSILIDASYQPSGDDTKYQDFLQDVYPRIKTSQWYTLSFWAKAANGFSVYIYGNSETTNCFNMTTGMYVDGEKVYPRLNGKVSFSGDSGWVKHTISFKTLASISTGAVIIIFRTFGANTLGLCMPKLELGDVATAYVADEGDLIGAPGNDGVSPYQIQLSQETDLINCDEDGSVLPGESYELCRLILFQGTSYKFSDFNITILPIGISCNGNSSSYDLNEETKESADSNGYYAMQPSAITADSAQIRITATLKTNSNFVLTASYKINKNKTGQTGKTGPSFYPTGEYDASTNNAFSRTDEAAPVVLYDGNYYYLKKSSNLRDGVRIPPTGNQYSSNYWGLASNFQVAFIKVLFALFAKLGSFVVNGDWFISQYGTLKSSDGSTLDVGSSNYETKYINSSGTITQNNSGRVGYTYFKSADPTASTNADSGDLKFAPKLAIDAKTGKMIGGDVEFNNGKFTGEIHATSGRFVGTIQLATGGEWGQTLADANIFYLKARTSMSGTYVMPCGEEQIGKVIRLYNPSTNADGKYEIFGTKFELPLPSSGYPFSGFTDDVILGPGEHVEFTCFEKFEDGSNVRKAEWRITNQRLKTAENSVVLAAGKITVDSSSDITMSGTGLTGVTASKLGTGSVSLSFSSGKFGSGYFVVATCRNAAWCYSHDISGSGFKLDLVAPNGVNTNGTIDFAVLSGYASMKW